MFEISRRNAPVWPAVFIALAGLAFSLTNALGKADALCVTSGCDLFNEAMTYKGYSLWWAGVAFFSIVLLPCLLGRRSIALAIAGFGLLADTLLLLFMAFTVPCLPCLGVAVFMALLFTVLHRAQYSRNRTMSILMLAWLIALCPNLFATTSELMGTWKIHGPERADIRVFFSPSCPVCVMAVEALAKDPAAAIAFYPVAEKESDRASLAAMEESLAKGTSFLVAFRRGTRDPDALTSPAGWPDLFMRWKIFRNKAHLHAMGVDTIPAILTNGVSGNLLNALTAPSPVPAAIPKPAERPATDAPGAEQLLPGLDAFSGCGQSAPEPCDEPEARP
ncbi:hypothetical protein [Desulfovibrio psychrotolerans]|uniref:Vitamin K epoxide reductase domain-containing protein n=1 Tax=Desulfovibrio psychrotolerans TaxID=415242 RepID=A0A7J0BUT0_9BACT|nr:hypothetical protein [Desulfovibrio psychrotolerans]GFM37460.1 hypothetical protein DSM19430T_21440 [Desulfovibrio psychrotolerans]